MALVPLSETQRDISLETPGAARVRLRQIAPKPYTVDRAEALASIGRLLDGTPDVELVWLVGRRRHRARPRTSSTASRASPTSTPITVVLGGVKPAHALTAADNAAGVLTVKVLRAATGAADEGLVRALDLKGLPLGEARFAFKSGDTRDRGAVRPAGRDPQRHRAPRDRWASARPAPCSCSTSAGGGAPSAS